MTDPWDEISPSDDAGTIHLRRADPDHPLDLFRGRDHEGNYIFSFKGKFAEQGLIRTTPSSRPWRSPLSTGKTTSGNSLFACWRNRTSTSFERFVRT